MTESIPQGDVKALVERAINRLNPSNGEIRASVPAVELLLTTMFEAALTTLLQRVEELEERERKDGEDRQLLRESASLIRSREYKSRVVRLEEDAGHWRALMRIGRIKMQGSSGVDPHTGERNGNNVHFGAEFWPEQLSADFRRENPEIAANCDRSTRWGLACLRALADAVVEDEARAALHPDASGPGNLGNTDE